MTPELSTVPRRYRIGGGRRVHAAGGCRLDMTHPDGRVICHGAGQLVTEAEAREWIAAGGAVDGTPSSVRGWCRRCATPPADWPAPGELRRLADEAAQLLEQQRQREQNQEWVEWFARNEREQREREQRATTVRCPYCGAGVTFVCRTQPYGLARPAHAARHDAAGPGSC